MNLAIQYLINGILAGISYSLLTAGYSLIYSTTKIFHLAHAAVYAASGLITWYLFTHGWSLWLAIPVSIVLGGILGAVMEIGVYRPLRIRGTNVVLVMIASLGILITVQNILAILFSPTAKNFPTVLEAIIIGPFMIPGWLLVGFVLGLLSIIALIFMLQHTRTGLEIRAVASNELMSRIVSINIGKTYLITIILGSMMAALAGIIVSIDNGANPYAGLIQLLTALVIMILGGVGNIKGAVVVGLLFGVLENTSMLVVSSEWKTSVLFAVFITLVLIKANPQLVSLEKMGGGL